VIYVTIIRKKGKIWTPPFEGMLFCVLSDFKARNNFSCLAGHLSIFVGHFTKPIMVILSKTQSTTKHDKKRLWLLTFRLLFLVTIVTGTLIPRIVYVGIHANVLVFVITHWYHFPIISSLVSSSPLHPEHKPSAVFLQLRLDSVS